MQNHGSPSSYIAFASCQSSLNESPMAASRRERLEQELKEGDVCVCVCYLVSMFNLPPAGKNVKPPAYSAFGMELSRDFMSSEEDMSVTDSSGEESSTDEK